MSILKRYFKSISVEPPGCRRCGICCELYGGSLKAYASDIARWKTEGRADILKRAGEGGELWIDPKTGEKDESCPFLVKSGQEGLICSINDTKPHMCRAYPTRAHMERCVMGVVFPAREDKEEERLEN